MCDLWGSVFQTWLSLALYGPTLSLVLWPLASWHQPFSIWAYWTQMTQVQMTWDFEFMFLLSWTQYLLWVAFWLINTYQDSSVLLWWNPAWLVSSRTLSTALTPWSPHSPLMGPGLKFLKSVDMCNSSCPCKLYTQCALIIAALRKLCAMQVYRIIKWLFCFLLHSFTPPPMTLLI